MPGGLFEDFVQDTVLKRDIFSETVKGHIAGAPDRRLVVRRLGGLGFWGRLIGYRLARREARALAAAEGIPNVPGLVAFGREGLARSWVEGTPLHLARPSNAGFYRDAKALLRRMRRRGITHNDLYKPQNWLMTPDGGAGIIDFQLASVRRRKGRMFRVQGYDDLRHLLGLKLLYAPDLVTPAERRVAQRRSLPSRIWKRTGKVAYNFVTRRLMHWSDTEGAGTRLSQDAARIESELAAHPAIGGVVICTYPLRSAGTGLYGFVETGMDPASLRRLMPPGRIEILQPVAALPRDGSGRVREDLLALVAGNRLDELKDSLAADDPVRLSMAPVIAGRLNLTDRHELAVMEEV